MLPLALPLAAPRCCRISLRSSAMGDPRPAAHLLGERGRVLGLELLVEALVDGHDRGERAASEALDLAQGDRAVLRGPALPDPEGLLEGRHDLAGAAQGAGDV